MLLITDTNHWRPANFQELRNYGVEANIVKATEGIDFLDSTFFPSVNEMTKIDMLWGAYHYFRHQYDSIKQAQHFYSAAKYTQLPPIIDVEKYNNLGLSKQLFTEKLREMILETQNLFGRRPWIYTGYYAWLELTTNTLFFKDYPLWLARYMQYPPSMIQTPYPWDKYILWQYTDREMIGGKPFDCNKFFGTKEELYALGNKPTPVSLEDRVGELEVRVDELEAIIDLGNGYGRIGG
jgi:lysozyme